MWDVCAFAQHFKSGVAFSSHTGAGGMNLSPFLFFSTSGSLLYCTRPILRCSNVKPLNSFSILVVEALRHYLSPDLYLTYKRCNFYSGGKKIISFISAANIQQKVWIIINHTGSLMPSYYKHEGISRHQGPKYILHLYECRHIYFIPAQYSYFMCVILHYKTTVYKLYICQKSSPVTCIWHLLLLCITTRMHTTQSFFAKMPIPLTFSGAGSKVRTGLQVSNWLSHISFAHLCLYSPFIHLFYKAKQLSSFDDKKNR